MSVSILSRAEAAYLGLAVGDALGATTEFMTPAEIKDQLGVHRQITGGGWLNLPRGAVTDDTTMALALGESIISTGAVDPVAVATAFSNWMAARPVDIGNTVRRGILHYRHSGESRVPYSEHDAGNGACMRVLPAILASYKKPASTIYENLRIQSHTTHNNRLSDAAVDCLAELVHACFDGAKKNELLHGPVARLIQTEPEFRFRPRYKRNPTGYIVDTMQVVFQGFFDTDDFESCLVDVVNRGGDSDTTAAIAGVIAGAFYGRENIPGRWLDCLDAEIHKNVCEQAGVLLALADMGLASGTDVGRQNLGI